jgi:hypothetical protein
VDPETGSVAAVFGYLKSASQVTIGGADHILVHRVRLLSS